MVADKIFNVFRNIEYNNNNHYYRNGKKESSEKFLNDICI